MRLLLISIWVSTPILLIYAYRIQVDRRIILYLVFYVIILWLSFFINVETMDFNFSGPNVEKFTIFLFVFHYFIWRYFVHLMKINGVSDKFISSFMIYLSAIVLLDALVRYYLEPSYFLNYQYRFEAKTIGFFTTANVTGQTIAFFLALSWFIDFQYKRFIQTILLVTLITTMARAAIVSLIFGYVLYRTFYRKGIISNLLKILIILGFLYLIIIDPLNFSEDGSFLSKIDFIVHTLLLIEDAKFIDFLFGFGASFDAIVKVLNVEGWSPHIPFLKAFLYFGLVGLIIYSFIQIYFINSSRLLIVPIIVLFVLGLAGSPIFWPGLSVGLIIVKFFESQKAKLVSP